ncbi:dethiobiotin synthase [Paraglaciecola sp. 2405UD69-4]|uniref:dethiobiotin synthase n=1 Tax=Paraglaciecola sp. 2405UD69-4 TaxID=3391836 RepID=UPI0039C90F94
MILKDLTSRCRTFFVTGTDTEVGKTFISAALLQGLADKHYKTAAYKPIAAGCSMIKAGLRNQDALTLLGCSTLELSYKEVNPIAYEPPIAPHLAAAAIGASISLELVNEGLIHLLDKKPDVLLVEGAGGWRLPLGLDSDSKPRYLSEFVVENNLAVILVVGMRLGCLNHAVLTAESIQQDGLNIAGWVANLIDPDMPMLNENINSLKTLINAPFLGAVPQVSEPQSAVAYLDFSSLNL